MIVLVSAGSGTKAGLGAREHPAESLGQHSHDIRPQPPASKSSCLVIFTLDEQHYALRLSAVERVVRLVSITTLPKSPEIISGIVNVGGRVIPVVEIRRRFRLPDRELRLTDCLLIGRTARRSLAFVVDTVPGVAERPDANITPADKIFPGLEYVSGVARFPDGLVFIHDLDAFLSLNEEQALDEALAACQSP